MKHHKFDRGLQFDEAKRRLLDSLNNGEIFNKAKNEDSKKQYERMIYILLICSRNGCRIGEGVNIYNQFCNDGIRQTEFVVEKRGHKVKYKLNESGGRIYYYDKITKRIRPRIVEGSERYEPYRKLGIVPEEVKNIGKYNSSKAYITGFAIKHFYFNPHTLRFAMMNELKRKGKDIQDIAYALGHTNSITTEKYFRKKTAEEIIKNDIKW